VKQCRRAEVDEMDITGVEVNDHVLVFDVAMYDSRVAHLQTPNIHTPLCTFLQHPVTMERIDKTQLFWHTT